MKIASVVCTFAAIVVVQGSQMDRSLGGKSTDKYHESVYDPRLKLYLFAGYD